jgi:uncharacterized Zn finger protein
MTIIEYAKVETTCSNCGRPIRVGDECVRFGTDGQTVCTNCHENMEDLSNYLAGKRTTPLIVRTIRRSFRRFV